MSKARALRELLFFWFSGPPGRLLSRIFWEFPQGLAAWGTALTCLLIFPLAEMVRFENSLYLRFHKKGGGVVAFTLGSVVIVRGKMKIGMEDRLCLHEYGHCLQSRVWGPLYLFTCALPSVFSFWGRGRNHRYTWVEKDANRRAWQYFQNKAAFPGWNFKRFPVK